ncbi:Fur family transcriptional regulator [Mahella australiensis]
MAIYEMLRGTKQHPSAEMIYKTLENDYPTMSLATVYKTIDILKDAGLIQELKDMTSTGRYDANTAPHPHIICIKCNKVDDLDLDISFDDELLHKAKEASGYDVLYSQVYFYGYCPDCRI